MAVQWGGVIMGPNTDMGTNEGWPIWGGKTRPNQQVQVDIDGTTHVVTADENGTWSFTPPEPLSNGEHAIEMRTVDANSGNVGEGGESFTLDVRRDPEGVDWERDQQAHREWEQGQRDAFHDANAPTNKPGDPGGGSKPPMTGGGTPEIGQDKPTEIGTTGPPLQPLTPQPGQGGGGGSPPPSEKGNAQKPTVSTDKGVGGTRTLEPAPPPSEKGNAPRA